MPPEILAIFKVNEMFLECKWNAKHIFPTVNFNLSGLYFVLYMLGGFRSERSRTAESALLGSPGILVCSSMPLLHGERMGWAGGWLRERLVQGSDIQSDGGVLGYITSLLCIIHVVLCLFWKCKFRKARCVCHWVAGQCLPWSQDVGVRRRRAC